MSILRCCLYFFLWLVAQIIAVNLTAVLISMRFPGLDQVGLNEMLNQLMVEMNIITGCITVLLLALFSKLTKTTLSKQAYINKYESGFSFAFVIMGVATAYSVALALGLFEMAGMIPDSWIQVQEQTYSDVNNASGLMQFFSVGLVAPVAEEILFRGFMLGALKKEMHPWVAIGVSALAFGVAHGTPLGMIYATGLGVLMGWLAVRFNSIVPSMIFHVAYNCTQAYSDGISLIVAVISVPILVLEIRSINKHFRGKKE